MLVHDLEEQLKREAIDKMNAKRQTISIGEYQFFAADLLNYITNLDVSDNTKNDLCRLVEKFYRDVVINEIVRDEING